MDAQKIERLHDKEVHSKRFWDVCNFLCREYWCRNSMYLEEELFELAFGEHKNYDELLKFLKSLNEVQKNSNIFFVKTLEYISLAKEQAPMIVERINRYDDSQIDFDIPQEHKDKFLHKIPTLIRMKQENKNFLVPILSEKRIYMYNEYNDAVDKLNKIANNVFYNEINKNIEIDNCQINGTADKFIIFKTRIKTYKKRF